MPGKKRLELRRVNEGDADFLWRLANDPQVRAASFSTDPISWETHVSWLKSKLNDPSCEFFIAYDQEGAPVGQARFDIKNQEAIISVSVKEEFRGKGYGVILIANSAFRIFELTNARRIHAYVKPSNKASISSFIRANFKDLGLTTFNDHVAIHLVLERG